MRDVRAKHRRNLYCLITAPDTALGDRTSRSQPLFVRSVPRTGDHEGPPWLPLSTRCLDRRPPFGSRPPVRILPLGAHQLAEFTPGSGNPALDGADGGAANRCRLLIAEAVCAYEHQCLAPLGGKCIEGAPELPELETRELRGLSRVGVEVGLVDRDLETAVAAQLAEIDIAQDSEDPTLEVRARRELSGGAESALNCALDQVVRPVPIARQGAGKGPQMRQADEDLGVEVLAGILFGLGRNDFGRAAVWSIGTLRAGGGLRRFAASPRPARPEAHSKAGLWRWDAAEQPASDGKSLILAGRRRPCCWQSRRLPFCPRGGDSLPQA